MSTINLNKKDLNRLKKAMDRVQNELNLHEAHTPSTDQFVEDIKLIVFELWAILKKHGLLHD